MTKTLTRKMTFEALTAMLNIYEEETPFQFTGSDGENYQVEKTELLEMLSRELATIERRAAAPKKPSKSQQENVAHKANLLAALAAADAPMGIADLREAVEGDLTPNKVSALMGQLVTEGKAARIPGKGKDRKVTFTLA